MALFAESDGSRALVTLLGCGAGMSGGGLLEERLQLQLSREEAVHYMQSLIHESLGALFPQATGTTHPSSRHLPHRAGRAACAP